jgi:uncharacterized protein
MDTLMPGYSLMLQKDADPNATGGVAICGFTTDGKVGAIATAHLINALNMRQLGTVMHADFPAVALVQDEIPKHPVRIYQTEGLGVFISQLQFKNEMDVMFGSTVLEWYTKGNFERLIIIDGVPRLSKDSNESELFGVSTSESSRKQLKSLGINTIQEGIVTGITGFLLSEGDRLGLDVTALLAEASPLYPDARAAAVAIEAVSDMTNIDIPLNDLLEYARAIEDSVQQSLANAQPRLSAPHDMVGESETDVDPSFM